ncbi:MAG: hypothetical protein IJT51_10300 [Bacteroidales bacterium]|jgi:ribosomal protein L18|nr:hypothetical protein [Bacteroidales bacterium]
MKKLFLVVLAAGLFAACGNGNKEADEAATNDSIPAQDEVVMDQPAEEAPVAEATTTTTEKETTIKEEAKKVGTEVAKEAINAGGDAAKEEIKDLPKKPRR